MNKIHQFIIALALLVVIGVPAQAASVAEQITSAIAKGDFKTVQTLVNGNPGSTGHAENVLLSTTLDKLVKKPQEAAQAMTVASSLTKGITPKDAGAIVENLKKIVKLIADKSLLICNPEANADASQTETPVDPKKLADAQAIYSIMDSAEAIAQTPAIVAIDPELFAKIQEQSGQCQTEDALLAQQPGARPSHVMPHLQNPGFPPPPKKQGSPD